MNIGEFSDMSKFVDEMSRIASSIYSYDLCKDNDHTKRVPRNR